MIYMMDTPYAELFANLLRLGRILEVLLHKQNSAVANFIRGGFSRWIFVLNKMGKFRDFNIVDLEAFKKIIDDDIKFISRRINIDTKELAAIHPPRVRNFDVEYANGVLKFDKYRVYITDEQYAHLQRIHTGQNLHKDIYIIGLFYSIIGGKNIHLSIMPKLIKEFGAEVELFGSPFNVCGPYCSPLEFERRFGSLGSFYDYKFESKIYAANPPYDEEIMNDMAERILEALQEHKCTFLVTLPVWDPQTQKLLQILPPNGYKPFAAFDKLIPHAKFHKVFGKNEFAYFNYYTGKKSQVVASHLLLLSSVHDFSLFASQMNRSLAALGNAPTSVSASH